ncbi:MAG: DUF2029 domain-containing protein [Rhizobiales bacterium]|nr:DUF2029 domain-containing protein [Hyphomicrobiales bacterium]
MLDRLRLGDWITRDRIVALSRVILLANVLLLGALFATSNGKVDRFDRPIGTDFSEIWVAGKFVLDGQPEKPFDNAAHAAAQREAFTPTSGFFAWGYPPMLLAVAAVFALFPYWLALLLWQGTTLPLYLAAVRAVLPGREALLAALAFPAVFVNIGHGHNGFLTAGLFGLGLVLLARGRPWIAGLCFGLLAYKPQFGLLLPLALLMGGQWRAIASATATVLVTAGATVAAWGLAPWRGFLDSLTFSRVELLEQGSTGFHKIQSAFAAARLNGGSVEAAYVAQGLVAALCVIGVALVWRSAADWRLKGAQLLTASLLMTPYCMDYDMMLLGPALAMAVAHGFERGFRPWEKTMLAGVFLAPFVTRNFAMATGVHLGLIAMLALFVLTTARALDETGALARWRGRAASGAGRQIGGFALAGAVGFAVDAELTSLLVH